MLEGFDMSGSPIQDILLSRQLDGLISRKPEPQDQLQVTEGQLELSARDDGEDSTLAYRPEDMKRKHFGLICMTEHADFADGKIENAQALI